MLLDTHNPYKPAVIDWPKLDSEARDRLVSLPIWDIAVQTEGKASTRVRSYAELVADPLLARRAAQRFRGGPPQAVLANLVAAYDVRLAPRARVPAAAACRMGLSWLPGTASASTASSPSACSRWRSAPPFFPRELVDTFEPVMQEEARTFLFLRQLGHLAPPQPGVVANAVVLLEGRGRSGHS
jgi:hypothetical protein